MFIDKLITPFQSVYGNHIAIMTILIFLIIATISDIKYLKIPNKLNLAFLISRLLLIPFMGFSISNIGGALLGFIVTLIPAMIKMHKMGGDIKCMTVIGLFLGFEATIVFIAVMCVYGLTIGLGKLLITKKDSPIPFAPFFLGTHITLIIISFLI